MMRKGRFMLRSVVLILLWTRTEAWSTQCQIVLTRLNPRRVASPWIGLKKEGRFVVVAATSPSSSSSSSNTSGSTRSVIAINNNIVLQPSNDDPVAFDSYTVGHARVHRYSTAASLAADGETAAAKAANSQTATEYVMWYHGRSQAQIQIHNNNNNDVQSESNEHVVASSDKPPASLPPFSTGRIGRATSRNGLIWIKDGATSSSSVSEDIPGVSLGLNVNEWWSFDTAHVGLGNVLLPMSTPAVMTEGGVYLMYYMGGNYDETDVTEYMSQDMVADDSMPEAFNSQKIVGMNMKIGVAISQDGVTWGRVEADHPTGACMVPYTKADPNSAMISPGTPMSILQEELYCAWPEVVPNFLTRDESNNFYMYYSTMTTNDKVKCIALASSPDGFRWFKRGICLKPDSDFEHDAKGCARCTVLQDASFDPLTKTWKSEPMWTMYYDGCSRKDGKHRILRAKSRDGVRWSKVGIDLDVGAPDAWDSKGVTSPYIIRMDDGTERMYYTGIRENGSSAIGVARLTPNGWEREQAAFTFALD